MNEDFDIKFGQRLKKIRKYHRLSQKALSNKMGLTQQQIAKYEEGSSSIQLRRLVNLCQILDVPAAYFVPEISFGEVLSVDEIELIAEIKKIFNVPEFLAFLKTNKSNVKDAHCLADLCKIKNKAQD